MKKIILMAMLLPAAIFAQEAKDSTNVANPQKYTLSVNLNVSEPSTFGLSFERQAKESKKSYVANLSVGAMILDTNTGNDIDGSGFVIEAGSRQYFDEYNTGFYGENFLTYGNIKFKENLPVFGNYEGTYSYFSMFNTNIGYKWNLGSFSIDPSIGYIWKWEIQNDNFENRDVDNFSFKFGIKAGYRF